MLQSQSGFQGPPFFHVADLEDWKNQLGLAGGKKMSKAKAGRIRVAFHAANTLLGNNNATQGVTSRRHNSEKKHLKVSKQIKKLIHVLISDWNMQL